MNSILPARFMISPHPAAPMYSAEADTQELIRQALSEMSSNLQVTESVRQFLRQTALVNLWFYTKYVAGFSGPFDKLNLDLHLEMANFRQSLLEPGSRGAMLIFRGAYKSSICTEAASHWEATRDPDIRIRLTNQIAEKAFDFMHSIRAISDSNPFYAWLFPECVPAKNAPRWNDTELVWPNRTKTFREATVEAGGTGGASEGHHFNLHLVDDPVGLKMLNSDRRASTEMIQAKNWFWSSEASLLVNPDKDRVILVNTRFALDDLAADVISRGRSCEGYPMPEFTPNPKGQWRLYYRMAEEDGRLAFPENLSRERLDQIAADDWWTYVTQYLNNPTASGAAELIDYTAKPCETVYRSGPQEWYITLHGSALDVNFPASRLDVVQACDPAALEKYTSAKASRSVAVVTGMDSDGTVYVMEIRADWIPTSTLFDWLFDNRQHYHIIRKTIFEGVAGFKAVGNLLRDEQSRRGIWLNLDTVPAHGDKDGRIRTTLEPLLKAGKLYCATQYLPLLQEELRGFPAMQRKDILDALTIAIQAHQRPASVDEREQMIEYQKRLKNHHSITGY